MALGLSISSCNGASAAPSQSQPPEIIELPPPRLHSEVSLEQALAARRSVREYAPGTLSLEQLGQLFWALDGENRAAGGRTAPSAGALYPLEAYVATREGFYHYAPRGHRAELLDRRDLRAELGRAAFDSPPVREAAAVFVITAVVARTAARYGARAERYATLEAGHAAQNLLLEAAAQGLGAVPIGAFEDAAVAKAMGLNEREEPLYLVPVGRLGGS